MVHAWAALSRVSDPPGLGGRQGAQRAARGRIRETRFTICPTHTQACTTHVITFFFCESSLLRISQRHRSLRTRLWHTPPAAVKNPTEENARERDLWGWAWAGTVAMDRSMCAHLSPPPRPRAAVLPLLLPPPPQTALCLQYISVSPRVSAVVAKVPTHTRPSPERRAGHRGTRSMFLQPVYNFFAFLLLAVAVRPNQVQQLTVTSIHVYMLHNGVGDSVDRAAQMANF
jgi:hypothetical protein